MITKFYKLTGYTEHWLLVKEWRPVYARWNRAQGWLSELTWNRIQPVWICDIEDWNKVWGKYGEDR